MNGDTIITINDMYYPTGSDITISNLAPSSIADNEEFPENKLFENLPEKKAD